MRIYFVPTVCQCQDQAERGKKRISKKSVTFLRHSSTLKIWKQTCHVQSHQVQKSRTESLLFVKTGARSERIFSHVRHDLLTDKLLQSKVLWLLSNGHNCHLSGHFYCFHILKLSILQTITDAGIPYPETKWNGVKLVTVVYRTHPIIFRLSHTCAPLIWT